MASMSLPSSSSRDASRREASASQLDERSERAASANSCLEFSIFDALLAHDDILLYLTTQFLEPRELFVLYRISRPFHYIVNQHITSYILSSARRWARLTEFRPSRDSSDDRASDCNTRTSNTTGSATDARTRYSASRQFMRASGTEPTPPGVYSRYDITTLLPFHNYQHLCSVDPAKRTLSGSRMSPPDPKNPKPISLLTSDPTTDRDISNSSENRLRHVPTFRYLQFVLQRARMIQLIIHHLEQQGHRVPLIETPAVLAKLSLTLDIPTNPRRFALFRSTNYWPNRDLYVANLFLIKIDMAFTDPVDGNGETMLRKLLLSQRGLEMLEGTLAKTHCRSLLETLRVWIRTWHRPAPAHRGYDILGVPASEVGKTGLEGWGLVASRREMDGSRAAGNAPDMRRREPLIRPDELIIAEAIRRQLPLHQFHVDMMTYGYLDRGTLDNLPSRESAVRGGTGATVAESSVESQTAAGASSSSANASTTAAAASQAAPGAVDTNNDDDAQGVAEAPDAMDMS